MGTFAAIDFETANYDPASACAVGIVIATDGRIVYREHRLIRPPSEDFVFTHIHGLTWSHVRQAADFGTVWKALSKRLGAVEFLAAHNASFDRGVLAACCEHYGARRPKHRFVCTVEIARRQWGIYPTKLPDVCRHLKIALRHHEADSDAEACARIVLAAEQAGWRP
jgi:DNA polymerase-3 subunit epsilon